MYRDWLEVVLFDQVVLDSMFAGANTWQYTDQSLATSAGQVFLPPQMPMSIVSHKSVSIWRCVPGNRPLYTGEDFPGSSLAQLLQGSDGNEETKVK